jgi:hypothetical protein
MKYRLKDRDLQRKLDEISGGDFSKRLQDPAKSEKGFAVAYGDFPEINGLRHLSLFLADEIEEVPEYDPNAWNVWPDTEPPCDVLLRIECYYEDDEPDENGQQNIRYRGRLKYSKDYGFGLMLNQSEKPQRIRFRPWIGPEEDK